MIKIGDTTIDENGRVRMSGANSVTRTDLLIAMKEIVRLRGLVEDAYEEGCHDKNLNSAGYSIDFNDTHTKKEMDKS